MAMRFKKLEYKPNLYIIEYLSYSHNSYFVVKNKHYYFNKFEDDLLFRGSFRKESKEYVVKGKELNIREFAPKVFHNIRYLLGYSDDMIAE